MKIATFKVREFSLNESTNSIIFYPNQKSINRVQIHKMTQIFNQFRNQLIKFELITNQFENKFLVEKFTICKILKLFKISLILPRTLSSVGRASDS